MVRSLIKRFLEFSVVTLSLLLLFAAPAHAGFISIQTELTPGYDGKAFTLHATIINRGDEAAHDVSIAAELSGAVAHSPEVALLGPNESKSMELTQDVAILKRGEYPVVVTVKYKDANHYPFSAISVAPLIYGDSKPSRIEATVSNLEFSDKKGFLNLTSRNLDGQPEEVSVRLVTPKELSVTQFIGRFTLDGGAAEDFRIPLSNISANPGSNYQVYALVEYEDGGLHYFTAANAYVAVIFDPGFVKSHRMLLISLCLMLGAAFIYSNAKFYWRQGRTGVSVNT
jgi:hypothetical protein